MEITLEELTHHNFEKTGEIDRSDISEDFVSTAETLMEITDYGIENHCIGNPTHLKCQNNHFTG